MTRIGGFGQSQDAAECRRPPRLTGLPPPRPACEPHCHYPNPRPNAPRPSPPPLSTTPAASPHHTASECNHGSCSVCTTSLTTSLLAPSQAFGENVQRISSRRTPISRIAMACRLEAQVCQFASMSARDDPPARLPADGLAYCPRRCDKIVVASKTIKRKAAQLKAAEAAMDAQRCSGTRMLPDAQILRCSDARMHGYAIARVLGCSDAQVLRCTDARMLGCSGARMLDLGCSDARETLR